MGDRSEYFTTEKVPPPTRIWVPRAAVEIPTFASSRLRGVRELRRTVFCDDRIVSYALFRSTTEFPGIPLSDLSTIRSRRKIITSLDRHSHVVKRR